MKVGLCSCCSLEIFVEYKLNSFEVDIVILTNEFSHVQIYIIRSGLNISPSFINP